MATVKSDPVSISKLSIKTMGCKPGSAKVEDKVMPMCRVMGVARGIKVAPGQDGDATYGLTGTFSGINLVTLQEYISSVCYLPGGIHETVLQPLDELLGGVPARGDQPAIPADPTGELSFAYDIFAAPDTNKAGYHYEARDLVATSRADPFAALKTALAEKPLPSLPAK
jgi:hypothetical protein